jgi:outer membrane biosynthesis protein TonB
MALVSVVALVAAFALMFALGKASKHSTAPAAASPALPAVALPSQKPKVSNLQTAGALPALRATHHKAKSKPDTSAATKQPQANQNQTQTKPQTQTQPQTQTKPQTKPKSGGDVVIGGGTG